MRSPFRRLSEVTIAAAVDATWGIGIASLRYVPIGAGAYHWVADGADGTPWFVTVDDLDTKPWLGSDRDAVFDALRAAYATAADLRAGGLPFVAAALTAPTGEAVVRLDDRHSVSVFEYLDGEAGQWGSAAASSVRPELLSVLARLHAAPRPRHAIVRRGLDVPGRTALDQALLDLDGRWDAGPFSEPLRRMLQDHATRIGSWLARLDAMATRLRADTGAEVLTHGEPHPGNLLLTRSGLRLVDWDTVALARPERDLWMIADAEGTTAAAYREATGRSLDPEALDAFRLLWALSDVAAYSHQLRSEHDDGADAERALAAVASIVDGREPAPYGVPPSL